MLVSGLLLPGGSWSSICNFVAATHKADVLTAQCPDEKGGVVMSSVTAQLTEMVQNNRGILSNATTNTVGLPVRNAGDNFAIREFNNLCSKIFCANESFDTLEFDILCASIFCANEET